MRKRPLNDWESKTQIQSVDFINVESTISEINIIPVKPQNGLLAFCSFILFESIYLSSIAVFSRPDGTYRLVYPTKKIGDKSFDICYPINKTIGELITQEVIKKYQEVINYDRHSSTNLISR